MTETGDVTFCFRNWTHVQEKIYDAKTYQLTNYMNHVYLTNNFNAVNNLKIIHIMSINFYPSSNDNLLCSVGLFYACDCKDVQFPSTQKNNKIVSWWFRHDNGLLVHHWQQQPTFKGHDGFHLVSNTWPELKQICRSSKNKFPWTVIL